MSSAAMLRRFLLQQVVIVFLYFVRDPRRRPDIPLFPLRSWPSINYITASIMATTVTASTPTS